MGSYYDRLKAQEDDYANSYQNGYNHYSWNKKAKFNYNNSNNSTVNSNNPIVNSNNPIININELNINCCDHKKDEKKHHDRCCDYKEVERQVNNPENDTTAPNMRITQSETSLARFNNFILYGFNDFNNFTGVTGTSSLSGFAFSNDLGNTWTDGGSIQPTQTGTNGGDPVIAVDRNGIFYYGQIGFETDEEVVGLIPQGVISVSTGVVNPDGTITMNQPQVVGRGQNPLNSEEGDQDKEWIAVGPDRNTPGTEALYITWTDFTTNPRSIRFSKYSTGTTLTPLITDRVIVPSIPNNFVSGSFVVVDNAGVIYVFYEQVTDPDLTDTTTEPRNYLNVPNRTIRMIRSTDGGNTFTTPIVIGAPFAAAATTLEPCGRPSIDVSNDRQIRMNEFPHASIAPDGTLYVVWNAGRVINNTTAFIDVILAYSQNGGATWQTVNISNDTTFSFFPTITTNKCGAHIQYNRFNDQNGTVNSDTGNGTFSIFMKSFSPRDGLSGERRISSTFSPVPVTNPPIHANVRPCYMGDYNQIITGPGTCLLHSWGDNRNVLNGLNNPDVFFKLTSHPCCDKKDQHKKDCGHKKDSHKEDCCCCNRKEQHKENCDHKKDSHKEDCCCCNRKEQHKENCGHKKESHKEDCCCCNKKEQHKENCDHKKESHKEDCNHKKELYKKGYWDYKEEKYKEY